MSHLGSWGGTGTWRRAEARDEADQPATQRVAHTPQKHVPTWGGAQAGAPVWGGKAARLEPSAGPGLTGAQARSAGGAPGPCGQSGCRWRGMEPRGAG